MIGLLQRVSEGRVLVDSQVVGVIDAGLLVLLCAERGDDERSAEALMDKLLRYRVFADENGKMNRSLLDTGGGLLLVPQFTLAADTQSGTRPSFTPAAPPDIGRRLFEYALDWAKSRITRVQSGVFGADMKVHLVNDGPVTFWLRTLPGGAVSGAAVSAATSTTTAAS